MTALTERICPYCGGTELSEEEGTLVCAFCGHRFVQKKLEDDSALLAALDAEKRERIANARCNLWKAVQAKYIDSAEVIKWCDVILAILPDDFRAHFYKVANGRQSAAVTEFLNTIDVGQYRDDCEDVIDFMIRSLKAEWLFAVEQLIERAFSDNPRMLSRYMTEYETEAQKVQDGIYDLNMTRDAFIMYSSKDMPDVMRLTAILEEKNISCFVAARNLQHGSGAVANYQTALETAIDNCTVIVFVSSENSRSRSCDAMNRELPYIKRKDVENSPPEFRNRYGSIPAQYQKPRVEFLLTPYTGKNVIERTVKEFFGTRQWVEDPAHVVSRVQDLLKNGPAEQFVAPAPTGPAESAAPSSGKNETMAVLGRANTFLENEEWGLADELFNVVLSLNPESAEAYLGKLMVELQVRRREGLKDCKQPFDDRDNYRKALRFANPALEKTLKGYIDFINERNKNAVKTAQYEEAVSAMQAAEDEDAYKAAADKFKELKGFRDANNLAKECLANAEGCRKDEIYSAAKKKALSDRIPTLEEAISQFESIRGWKDADDLRLSCRKKIDDIKAKEEADRREAERRAEERRQEALRLAEERRIRKEKARKRNIRIAIIGTPILVCLIAFVVLMTTVIIPSSRYKKALALKESGKFNEAIAAFEALNGYRDSAEQIAACEIGILDDEYDRAVALYNAGQYDGAIRIFEQLGNYRDSTEQIALCRTAIRYDEAINLMDAGQYGDAITVFRALGSFRDSAAKIDACETAILDGKYNDAVKLYANGSYYEAIRAFRALDGYRDSLSLIDACETAMLDEDYSAAMSLYYAGRYDEAILIFRDLDGYRDSEEQIRICETAILNEKYNSAVKLYYAGNYDEAIAAFNELNGYRDSVEMIDACKNAGQYEKAVALYNAGKFEEAIAAFETLNGYRDSADWIIMCETAIMDGRYDAALGLYRAGRYEEAIAAFEALNGYRDSAEQIAACEIAILEREYDKAKSLLGVGKYEEALRIFKSLDGYRDSAEQIEACQTGIDYNEALGLMNIGQYAEAIEVFRALDGYRDSAARITECENAIISAKYTAAVRLYTSGKYEEAIAAFEELDGYRDSASRIEACRTALKDRDYNAAVALYNTGKYDEAIAAFTALNGHKDSASYLGLALYQKQKIKCANATVGSTIVWGTYEQDNNAENGKEEIEWIVLAKSGTKMLVLSKYALDCQSYSNSFSSTTWKTGSLRSWLNGTFYNTAFEKKLQSNIVEMTVSASANPMYGTDPGNTTSDKIFLLGISEIESYLSNFEERQCVPTAYAIAKGAFTDSSYQTDGEVTCWWWLRSPGLYQDYAAFIHSDGLINYEGGPASLSSVAVRPAMWLDLSK